MSPTSRTMPQGLLAMSLCLGLCSATDNVVMFSMESEQGGSDLPTSDPAVVTVNVQQALNTISSHFVGITVDSQQIRYNWNGLDFSSNKLHNMARALAPTYFRLGGTAADYMTYDLEKYNSNGGRLHKGEVHCANFTEPFNMTADHWDTLDSFLAVVGWDFIMDLNALKRNTDGSWNPGNARQLLQYSAERNYTIAGFELGNDSWLQEDPELFGLHPFISKYYFSAKEHYLPHFTDIHVMDSLGAMIDSAVSQGREVDPLLPVWLSETSSAFGCGTPNMSDRFVAGFLWLDKLGLCAVKGVQSVIRQDFYGFNYGLLDLDMNPNPFQGWQFGIVLLELQQLLCELGAAPV